MTSPNPYEAAMTATKPASLVKRKFGYVFHVEARFVALVRGQGRVTYDARIHDKRSTEIVIQVEHRKADGSPLPLKQDALDWSKEWAITRESLAALGITDVRNIHNRYVAYEWTGTGEYWTNRDGERKENQAMKFVQLFNNREECEAAEREFYSPRTPAVAPDVEAYFAEREAKAAVPAPVVPVNDVQRQMAATFLPMLWQQAGKNADAFHALIAATPTLAPLFNASSPEVVALTTDITF